MTSFMPTVTITPSQSPSSRSLGILDQITKAGQIVIRDDTISYEVIREICRRNRNGHFIYPHEYSRLGVGVTRFYI